MKQLFALVIVVVSFSLSAQKTVDIAKDYQQYFPDAILDDTYISDQYTSGGIHHIYFQQAINGVPIIESRGGIHYREGSKPYITNRLIPALQTYSIDKTRSLSAAAAVTVLAQNVGYDASAPLSVVEEGTSTIFSCETISISDIPVKEIYYVSSKATISAGYEILIEQVRDAFMYNYIIDANSGDIVNTIPLTLQCNFEHPAEHKHSTACSHEHEHRSTSATVAMDDSSYMVYPWPLESPNFGSRSSVTTPWSDNIMASPQGWHHIDGTSYTSTRGNNVDAYIDDDDSNGPTNGDDDRAVGDQNMIFDFDLDITAPPENYKDAAVTNLFYWSNVIHDVLYNYGFDEASGNFQEVNYGTQGEDSDYVRAEAQDGSGTCNANMSTPPDGGNGRMQMYLCGDRDGDLDNGVIAHEYGHGLSIRLTGGPGTSGCLSNTEQMGEGWSDYLGMIMTIEQGDQGSDSRGMGTWLFGEGPDGNGIRPFPYSTDFAVNPMTYDNISNSNISVPHGVGSIWCTMLWDMTWALIDQYGFDPDLYNGTGGNNMAFALVVEGMKLQPCSPGFVDGRDAILQADELLYGGANRCLIWQAFADRGLGFSASQGSSGSRTDGTPAFDVPRTCTVELHKTASVSEVIPGEEITYKLKADNFTPDVVDGVLISDKVPINTSFVSATSGGYLENDSVKWPLMTLVSDASDSVYFTVQVDPMAAAAEDIVDDLESGLDNWELSASGSTSWGTVSDNTNSGQVAFFAPDNSTTGVANIDLAMAVTIGDSTALSFYHQFDTESNYDGGVLEISTDDGITWTDLGPNMIQGGYNNNVLNSRDGWSGNSGGWIQTVVDLSSYVGESAIIRFQMLCDFSVADVGWWVDDISIIKLGSYIPNRAHLRNERYDLTAVLQVPTKVLDPPQELSVSTTVTDVRCHGNATGSITTIPAGGSGTYTYQWSTGATTAVLTDVPAGSYTVTVTAGIEEVSTTAIVQEPDELVSDATGLSVTAAGLSDGQVEVSTSGGTVPYEILWSTGSTATSQSQLAGGQYAVTVIDDNACQSTDDAIVADPATCADALYELTFKFGDAPEDISFALVRDADGNRISEEGPYTGQSIGSVITRWFCLPADCYTLSIMDAGGDGLCNIGSYSFALLTTGEVIASGCDIGAGIEIPFCAEDYTFRVEGDITDVSCNGTADGVITAAAINGSGNYTYTWQDGSTGPTIAGLAAGEYSVTATDMTSSATTTGTFEVLGSKYSMVVNLDDDGPGSLRQVLSNGCNTDTVLFSQELANEVITLTSGSIEIDDQKLIIGLGSDMLAVDAASNSRIFDITNTGIVEIRDITLTNGSDTPDGGNILNEGILTLQRVRLQGGTDSDAGPRAMTNRGTLQIIDEVDVDE